MTKMIARIVGSNSHIEYFGRIVDRLDVELPPSPGDYGFAHFVGVKSGDATAVGVIYNSKLINPDYASFGPRLSPRADLASFSPDFINEQGILIAILLLGTLEPDGTPRHGVPRRVIEAGSEVFTLEADAVSRFHIAADNAVLLHYYPQIVAHAGEFAVPLLQAIIDALCADCGEIDKKRLSVLKQSLAWQRTLGGIN